MCANVNIVSVSQPESGLRSEVVNFQRFLYMISESFVKTNKKKKNAPWSAIVSSVHCFVSVVLSFHLTII